MNIVNKQKIIDHPLEEVFNIESSSTLIDYKEAVPMEPIQCPTYDEKDVEIENQFEEIYNIAMTQVAAISDEMERVEGRHKARMGEVTSTMLNVALAAVKEKNVMKMAKDRNHNSPRGTAGAQNVTNNLNIVADRNDILRALAAGRKT